MFRLSLLPIWVANDSTDFALAFSLYIFLKQGYETKLCVATHYYSQQSIILQKELTKFATIASVTIAFCGKSNLTKVIMNTSHY